MFSGAEMFPDLSAEMPAGENLELDVEYGALERAALGRPETQYGETITPATPPDWHEAETTALRLLERTRDLRIMVHLAVARLHLSGVPAFADILTQIRLQLEKHWAEVHPQLDAEEDNDPTLRSNVLYQLGDPARVQRPLRDLPLANAARTGPVSWRDIEVFLGAVEPDPGKKKPTEALIRDAFEKTDQTALAHLRQAVDQAVQDVMAIPVIFEAAAGPGTGPTGAGRHFNDLSKLLVDIQKGLRRFEVIPAQEPVSMEPVPLEQVPVEKMGVPESTSDQSEAVPQTIVRRTAGARSIAAITTRDDALYLLELASAYFRTYEPSSPVPMLIGRAQRLARMEFMEILRDLAPDGLGQAQVIAGTPEA
jgi:type VI secretion system protein ImpA